MQANKRILLLAAAILLMGTTVEAEPTTNAATSSTTNRLPFDVASKQEFVPGLPTVTRVYVTNGTETCALLTPVGYRVDSSVQTCIQLVNETYDCFMTFRITEKSAEGKALFNSIYCRTLLSNHYPGVTILEEFSQGAGGLSGLAFDFQWQENGRTPRAARVVFVPSRAGILEFSLVCSPDKFHQVRHDFNSLLLTFRVSEGGKLEIAPRSNLF